MYSDRRVYINANDLTVGNTAKLTYSGDLANISEEIYVHLGYGLLWENITEVKMSKANNKFFAYIPVINADSLNFCLRNNNNKWDNNSGANYTYEIKKPMFNTQPEQNLDTNLEISAETVQTVLEVSETSNNNVDLPMNTQLSSAPMAEPQQTETTTTSTLQETTTTTQTAPSTNDITVEIACEPVEIIPEKVDSEIDIEIACADESTANITEVISEQDMITEQSTQPIPEPIQAATTAKQKSYADLTETIVISNKKSSEHHRASDKIKPWKTTQNYSEDDDVCLNIANIAINNSTSKTTKIACDSINIENVHKLDTDNFEPNSTLSKLTTNMVPSNNVPNYSSIPTNMSLAPMRKVSEDYLRKKRMKIALYRVFAYIPRMVTGNSRKNRSLWK